MRCLCTVSRVPLQMLYDSENKRSKINYLQNKKYQYNQFIYPNSYFMHKSFFNFEFKSVEIKDGKVKIKGFASTPDIDRYNDIVDTKAFDSSIATYMKNPIILLQHDASKPIGKCIDFTLDEK